MITEKLHGLFAADNLDSAEIKHFPAIQTICTVGHHTFRGSEFIVNKVSRLSGQKWDASDLSNYIFYAKWLSRDLPALQQISVTTSEFSCQLPSIRNADIIWTRFHLVYPENEKQPQISGDHFTLLKQTTPISLRFICGGGGEKTTRPQSAP